MANREHLELLEQGRLAWNAWRYEHPDIFPDLSGADLAGKNLERFYLRDSDLEGVNLTDANLSFATLSRANLRIEVYEATVMRFTNANLFHARLREANLMGADFKGASLDRADLFKCNLFGARLVGASLIGASLTWADLAEAELDGANFRNAEIGNTNFGSNDLRKVSGLDAVRHRAGSNIDIHTIYRSKGNIPEVFLRGCGVPDDFITHMPSLIVGMQPIQFYSCFISYSHADKSFARRLHDALQGRGIRCWLDDHEMLPGDNIYAAVDRGIRL